MLLATGIPEIFGYVNVGSNQTLTILALAAIYVPLLGVCVCVCVYVYMCARMFITGHD